MKSLLYSVSTPAHCSATPDQQAQRHASSQAAQSEKKNKHKQEEEVFQLQSHEQLLVALRSMALLPEKRPLGNWS